jgi:hypothetical protein
MTAKELNREILKITTMMEEKFPELSKNMGEMPAPVSNPEAHVKNLQEYYDSLEALLKKYSIILSAQ